jgi:hypothetical protein
VCVCVCERERERERESRDRIEQGLVKGPGRFFIFLKKRGRGGEREREN